MPDTDDRLLPDLAEWQAEVLRLTAFRASGDPDPDFTLWQSVAKDVPEFQTSKPKTGERQVAGPFGDGKLFLHVQPIRLDWFYFPYGDGKDADQRAIPFPTSLDVFFSAMKAWLESGPDITRLAFGAIARLPVADRDSGYRLISNLLPFKVDPQTSSDFLYQINRPLDSVIVSGLKINRLAKWSVGLLSMQAIEMKAQSGEAVIRALSQDSYCRIELDVNTAPEPAIDLPKDRLAVVFEELLELGVRIVREGDQA